MVGAARKELGKEVKDNASLLCVRNFKRRKQETEGSKLRRFIVAACSSVRACVKIKSPLILAVSVCVYDDDIRESDTI